MQSVLLQPPHSTLQWLPACICASSPKYPAVQDLLPDPWQPTMNKLPSSWTPATWDCKMVRSLRCCSPPRNMTGGWPTSGRECQYAQDMYCLCFCPIESWWQRRILELQCLPPSTTLPTSLTMSTAPWAGPMLLWSPRIPRHLCQLWWMGDSHGGGKISRKLKSYWKVNV